MLPNLSPILMLGRLDTGDPGMRNLRFNRARGTIIFREMHGNGN
jgi:hypothetical protein